MSAVVIRNLSKSYAGPHGAVLRDLHLELAHGSFATLIGPNGCGKSTLLRIIAGVERLDEGEVLIEANEVLSKQQVGLVWQDYRASLLPWLTVQDNVAFPIRLSGASRSASRLAATAALERVGLHHLAGKRCYELSGGQQQMVCLVRSLIMQPYVLLLDEPFSALDQYSRWSMGAEVERLWIERPVPVLFVTHDVDEAVLLADRVLLMGGGSGRIDLEVSNSLPRPRSLSMLTASEHVRCREQIIEFLHTSRMGTYSTCQGEREAAVAAARGINT